MDIYINYITCIHVLKKCKFIKCSPCKCHLGFSKTEMRCQVYMYPKHISPPSPTPIDSLSTFYRSFLPKPSYVTTPDVINKIMIRDGHYPRIRIPTRWFGPVLKFIPA